MSGAQIALLPDGRRLHLHHGPIDLIVESFGAASEVGAAYRQAAARFETILAELAAELPRLREPAAGRPRHFAGRTARRMEHAVVPHAATFITPMAAVAGSVADEILAALLHGRSLDRAYVNNGGDIALHLTPGETFTTAIALPDHASEPRIVIGFHDPVRGIATSGWRGRSFSLGIADAVTVLAADGASADAAATIIANAVDLPGHLAIAREAASDRDPDSDLKKLMVTVGVGDLTSAEVSFALDRGYREARRLQADGLIAAAALFLNRHCRIIPASSHREPDMALHPIFMDTVLDFGIRESTPY